MRDARRRFDVDCLGSGLARSRREHRRSRPCGDRVRARLRTSPGRQSHGRLALAGGAVGGRFGVLMPAGLFELRKDVITGWWVATIVDRAFHRDRFALAADPVDDGGGQAGARTNHLCLDLYDLPQVPHRVAEELGGAARFVIREGECPWCRALREEPAGERLIFEDPDTVAYAPYASRSPFEVWVVPRRHEADFGRASDAAVAATAEGLRQVLGRLATLDGPPYNLVLHTGPLREQVESTYHWHWEIHPRLRDIAGLELGTGLPVNPVSPEDAVEELLGRVRPAFDGTREATG